MDDNSNSPILTIIAGCNGSGKSSFSNAVSPDTPSFDYDKVFLSIYSSLKDSELRETIAHNQAFLELEKQIDESILSGNGFTYETNFENEPLYWPTLFKKHNYNLRLIYFCLNSIDEAKRRVQIRVENGGHFVSQSEIERRYYLGYKHLNSFYHFFGEVHLFNTSDYGEKPKHILSIENGKITNQSIIPAFLHQLLPDIL